MKRGCVAEIVLFLLLLLFCLLDYFIQPKAIYF